MVVLYKFPIPTYFTASENIHHLTQFDETLSDAGPGEDKDDVFDRPNSGFDGFDGDTIFRRVNKLAGQGHSTYTGNVLLYVPLIDLFVTKFEIIDHIMYARH